jgi:hypothetical protein
MRHSAKAEPLCGAIAFSVLHAAFECRGTSHSRTSLQRSSVCIGVHRWLTSTRPVPTFAPSHGMCLLSHLSHPRPGRHLRNLRNLRTIGFLVLFASSSAFSAPLRLTRLYDSSLHTFTPFAPFTRAAQAAASCRRAFPLPIPRDSATLRAQPQSAGARCNARKGGV